VRFREWEADRVQEGYTGETINISRTGVFFITKVPLALGTTIQLAMRVPRELSGSAKSEVQCRGKIMRMETFEGGSIGYGTRIDLRQTAGALMAAKEMVETVTAGTAR